MANEDHVVRIKQGAKVWNTWREEKPDLVPDLIGADLSNTILTDADFRGADLSYAKLSGAKLSGAKLSGAKLRDADLRGADLRGADLSWGAQLPRAKLCDADLRTAALIDSQLDGADLTGAMLWETQRGGWSIKGITCQRAFWDRDGKEVTEYEDGAFERIFAEKPRIVLRYPYPRGISSVELAMLPLIVERLQAEHPECRLHIRSVQDDGSGATVTITVDDFAGRNEEKLAIVIETLRCQIADLQRDKLWSQTLFETMLQKWMERPMTNNDTYHIQGPVGAVGHGAQAHNFQQIWNQGSLDLSRLAEELAQLRAAMKQETEGTREQDKAVVAVAYAEEAAIMGDGPTTLQHLKTAGQWTLGIAEKIGVAVAAEAIKKAM